MVAVDEQLLRVPEVLAMVGVGKNKLEDMVAAGDFPAPLWIGPKARRWRRSEILAWIESLSANRE